MTYGFIITKSRQNFSPLRKSNSTIQGTEELYVNKEMYIKLILVKSYMLQSTPSFSVSIA